MFFQATEYDLLVEEDQIGFVMAEQIPGTKRDEVKNNHKCMQYNTCM